MATNSASGGRGDQSCSGSFTAEALMMLCIFKFVSWSIALVSGTSGGTLAPLFTIGGTLGSLMAIGLHYLFPHLSLDARMAGRCLEEPALHLEPVPLLVRAGALRIALPEARAGVA